MALISFYGFIDNDWTSRIKDQNSGAISATNFYTPGAIGAVTPTADDDVVIGTDSYFTDVFIKKNQYYQFSDPGTSPTIHSLEIQAGYSLTQSYYGSRFTVNGTLLNTVT